MNIYKGGLVNFLGFVIPGLIFIPLYGFFSRVIDSEVFSLFVSFNIFVAYLVFLDGGLSRVVVYFVSKRSKCREAWFDVITAAIIFCTAVSIVSVILFNATVYFFDFDSINLVGIKIYLHIAITLVIPSSIFNMLFMSIYEANYCIYKLNLFRIIQGLLFSLFPFLVSISSASVYFIFVAAAVSRVIVTFCLYLSLKSDFLNKYSIKYFSKNTVSDMYSYGKWLIFTNVLSPTMTFADRFLITSSMSVNHLYISFYGTFTELVSKLSLLPLSFCRALFPKLVTDEYDIRSFTVRYSVFIFLLTMFFSLIFGSISQYVMKFWVNLVMDESMTYTAWVLLFSFVINSTSQVYFSALQARGFSKSSAIIILCQIVPTLVLMYVLFDRVGMLGLALALLIRNFFDLFINLYCFLKLSSGEMK